jgi:hypothetical protein
VSAPRPFKFEWLQQTGPGVVRWRGEKVVSALTWFAARAAAAVALGCEPGELTEAPLNGAAT